MRFSTKALLASSAILIALIAARAYYSLVTGYILPDESFYFNLFLINGGLGFSSYRPFFHVVFDLFFYGTTSLQALILRGATFSAAWGLGCLFVFYKLLKELGLPERASSYAVLALPFFPVFSVMAVFFVTETVALFLVLCGLLFTVRFLSSRKSWQAALSALFFVFGSQTREPYMVLLLGVPLYLAWKRIPLRPFVSYAAVASIAAPVPTRLSPLAIDTPVQRFLFDYLPSLFKAQGPPSPGSSSIPGYVFFAQNHVGISTSPQVGLAFIEGLAFGFGPLAILVIASLFLVKNRFIIYVSVLSFLAYLVVVDFSVIFFPDATTSWVSNIFRLSSAALPSALCLGWLFSHKVPLKVYGSMFCLGLIVLVPLPSVLQSSQNLAAGGVDRLSLDYRAPYYRMEQIAPPGSLIITNVGLPQMMTFASFDRNITVVGLPANLTEFDRLVQQGWTRVYLYDEWVSLLNPSFFTTCQCYPAYYVGLLYGGDFTTLWSDGESYALEVVR